jgi:hypothetical protein
MTQPLQWSINQSTLNYVCGQLQKSTNLISRDNRKFRLKKKLVQSQHLENSAHGVAGVGRGGRVGRPPREAEFKGGKINNLNEKCYLILSTNFKLLSQTQRNSINNFCYA